MKYLEGVELIKTIEKEYNVMSIHYKGVCAWSYLRLYLLDRITANREFKATKSVISLVLRCLFSYNPFQIFSKYDIWLFTGCERRKRVGDKMVQRVSGGISNIVDNCLMIEKPNKEFGHFKRIEIEEKHIVSESWLLMILHIIEVLSRPFTPKIENEDIIVQILKEKGISFDYKHYLRLLNAQRLAMKLMLSISHKPKCVFMESPYDSMGYMWAFHQAGVRVIEMQHGVLNSNHNAYNAIDYERKMNPDCICVFGEEEFKYFTTEKPQYASKVETTGLFMLEKADDFFKTDLFIEERKKYTYVIVVAGEANFEKKLGDFVDEIAKRRKDLLFIYIPRYSNEKPSVCSDNIRIVTDVNIYEYLKWADVHMTISSTTCLEAHYFHTPTIFVNFNNLSKEYYWNRLQEINGARYIENADQFDMALTGLLNQDTIWKELFAHNHTAKIKRVIKETLTTA